MLNDHVIKSSSYSSHKITNSLSLNLIIIIIIKFGTMPISLLVDSRDCTRQEKVT